MPNISDKLQDLITGHTVDLLRVDASIRGDVIQVLSELEDSLEDELRRIKLDEVKRTQYKRKRLEKLLEQTKDTIDSAYADISGAVSSDLVEITGAVEAQTVGAVNSAINAEVLSVGMSQEMLESIASDALIEGAPSSDWWKRQADSLQASFGDQIRQGMLRGETLNELARRIRGTRERGFKDGLMAKAGKQAEALIRTSVQAVANDARKKTYANNDDIIKAVEWSSTLDGRTTDTCKALDGLQWDLDNKPIGHNKQLIGPPHHFACRSTLVPVLKSWEELGAKGKFEEIPESTRASMDGQVSAGLNYEDWLRKKDEQFQIDVLGKGKYDLWKAGKISFTDLVDMRGNPLTVEELKKKYGA